MTEIVVGWLNPPLDLEKEGEEILVSIADTSTANDSDESQDEV